MNFLKEYFSCQFSQLIRSHRAITSQQLPILTDLSAGRTIDYLHPPLLQFFAKQPGHFPRQVT